jgi:hypothetical protein
MHGMNLCFHVNKAIKLIAFWFPSSISAPELPMFYVILHTAIPIEVRKPQNLDLQGRTFFWKACPSKLESEAESPSPVTVIQQELLHSLVFEFANVYAL